MRNKKQTGKFKLKQVKKMNKNSNKNYFTESIPPNYYARFRFNLDELLDFLQHFSGKPFAEIPQVYQCLDDLGYWSLVRNSEIFEYTLDLEESLTYQFKVLSDTFDYRLDEVLVWGDLTKPESEKFLVKIEEKFIDDEQEIYRVEILHSQVTILVSRYELDYWNASGSSLPLDSLVEMVDWSKDKFWQMRLENFKSFMASQNFIFNFKAPETEIESQRKELCHQIKAFFSLEKGSMNQRGRGLGLLSCGSGEDHDSLLVLAFSLQALGQSFGIISRLWGKMEEFDYLPTYLKVSFAKLNDSLPLERSDSLLSDVGIRPIQRPMSEVLKKVLAKGPFGKWESEAYIKSKLPNVNKSDESQSDATEVKASTDK